DSSDRPDDTLPMSGRSGSPRAALSWIVAVTGRGAVAAARWTSVSSCAALRAGSAGAACAAETSAPPATGPTRAATPAGTAQRARGENLRGQVIWLPSRRLPHLGYRHGPSIGPSG